MVVVAVFLLGFLVGIAVCVAVALVIERNSRGQKPPVVVSMVRHPGITVRFWLDPNYRAVTRDLRRVFGE
ncbi:MAG TPA: hypothetical protein VMQ81_03090 [Acidimicrobiia bacterium]|nr:hypothetical protein [Acidimicrobiia bacterium]